MTAMFLTEKEGIPNCDIRFALSLNSCEDRWATLLSFS
jgi:hypothetical protein